MSLIKLKTLLTKRGRAKEAAAQATDENVPISAAPRGEIASRDQMEGSGRGQARESCNDEPVSFAEGLLKLTAKFGKYGIQVEGREDTANPDVSIAKRRQSPKNDAGYGPQRSNYLRRRTVIIQKEAAKPTQDEPCKEGES